MSDNITVEFRYESNSIKIQGKKDEKMKNIYQRFFNKSGQDFSNKKIYFSYNGKWGNDSDGTENLTFWQMAKEEDRKRRQMIILVAENTNIENDIIIESKEIICPQCKEYTHMNIKNYKISLYDCKNRHTNNNILLREFKNTQFINFSNITCGNCNKKRSNIFQNEMD